MEAAIAPTPVPDSRTRLHHLIDQIQDEAVLQATLLLLLPQAPPAEAEEPELSPAWREELDKRLKEEYDPSKGVPFAEVMQRLQQSA